MRLVRYIISVSQSASSGEKIAKKNKLSLLESK